MEALEVFVEVFLRTQGEKLEVVFIQNAIGQQTQLMRKSKFAAPNANEIANLGLTYGWI